ncbi:C39 family peptidase [Lysinibacillus sp. LZ02]|uniref:C39 family peptidase n=1 Tax=Lysinibacillus sp. LZ02 TaxID=3420668 RepID=UPI003D364C98
MMKWRLPLIISSSILLIACGEEPSPVSSSAKMVVLPVEYYSGAAVSDVLVELYDATGNRIGAEVSYDGEAVFGDLQSDEMYSVRIGATDYMDDKAFISEKSIVFDSSNPYVVVETNAVNHQQALAVPVVKQNPQLPHGCEITSLTAVLNYYGADVDKMTMANNYLPKQPFKTENGVKYGPNPDVSYAGNPSEQQGTYAFANPIVKAAQDYISKFDMNLIAHNISGSTEEDIEMYVKLGIPVISWVTLDLSEPRTKGGWIITGTNTFHDMYVNLHAVVLVGVGEHEVEVMDPLKGIVKLNKQQFFASYRALGEQAVVLY